MKDIKFLIDEKKIKEAAELKKILEMFDDRKHRMRHLSRFVRALFTVAKRKRNTLKEEKIQEKQPLPRLARPEAPNVHVVERIVHVKENFPLPPPPAPHNIKKESVEQWQPAIIQKPVEYDAPLIEGKLDLSFHVHISSGIYTLKEPEIDGETAEGLDEFFKGVEKKEIMDEKKMRKKTQKMFKKMKKEFSEEDVPKIQYALLKKEGLGKIEPLLHDPHIKNIFCENGDIMVEHDELMKLKTNIHASAEEIDDILGKIADAAGKSISEEKPLVVTDYREFKVSATAGFGHVPSTFSIKRS